MNTSKRYYKKLVKKMFKNYNLFVKYNNKAYKYMDSDKRYKALKCTNKALGYGIVVLDTHREISKEVEKLNSFEKKDMTFMTYLTFKYIVSITESCNKCMRHTRDNCKALNNDYNDKFGVIENG